MLSEEEKSRLFKSIKRGDKIWIVEKWTGNKHNRDGDMNCYLGKQLEVDRLITGNINILLVKHNSWVWHEEMIDFEKTFDTNKIQYKIKVNT